MTKEYTEADIQIIDDPTDFMLRHPEMFLPDGRADLVYLADAVAEAAQLLGAGRVYKTIDDRWATVTCEVDYLGDDRRPFNRIVPFVEQGMNCHRPEVLLTVYTQNVVIQRKGEPLEVITGDAEGISLELAKGYTLAIAFKL